MITFEILESPDPFVVGTHTFNRNILKIGKENQDVNIFDDATEKFQFIMFEVEGTNLFIHQSKNLEKILVNKKRTTRTKKIAPSDLIQFGGTLLKIINFSLTPYESQREKLHKNLDKIQKEESLSEIKLIIDKTKEYLGLFNEI